MKKRKVHNRRYSDVEHEPRNKVEKRSDVWVGILAQEVWGQGDDTREVVLYPPNDKPYRIMSDSMHALAGHVFENVAIQGTLGTDDEGRDVIRLKRWWPLLTTAGDEKKRP